MYGPQVKLLLTFGFFLLQWLAIDSRPADTQGHVRHRRNLPEFDAAHLGALVADEPGILNEECVPLYDCEEIYEAGSTESGLYRIDPGGKGDFTVFCDMELLGGGWTVIQRRVDGTISFDRPWKFYRNGFGNFSSNFWLGLNKIKRITDMNGYELYVGLEDQTFSPTYYTAWTRYGSFSLSSEENHYRLFVSNWNNCSTAGRALDSHNERPFSTPDMDNDAHSNNCAETYNSGWWFKDCHKSNLNGVWYAKGDTKPANEGIIWEDWKGDASLKTTVMAIRMLKPDVDVDTCTYTVNANS